MLRAALLVTLVLVFACPAFADNVILAGSVNVMELGPHRYTFSFSGANFNFIAAARAIGGSVAPVTGCTPCAPGATVNLGTQTNLLRPSDFLSGLLQLNGTNYFFYNLEDPTPPPLPQVQPYASFTFVAGGVTVPTTGQANLLLSAAIYGNGLRPLARSGWNDVFRPFFRGWHGTRDAHSFWREYVRFPKRYV
jgi:hypothetical protein